MWCNRGLECGFIRRYILYAVLQSKLSDSLREKITEYAREDAAQNIYMGNKFLALRKREVAKVAPDRTALMEKADRKKIRALSSILRT